MLICPFKSLLRRKLRRCYTASDCDDTSHFAHSGRSSWSGQRHLVLVPGKYAGPDAAPRNTVLVGWLAIRFAGVLVCAGAHTSGRRAVLGPATGVRRRTFARRKTLEGSAGHDVRGRFRYRAGALRRPRRSRISPTALLRSTVARTYWERRRALDSPASLHLNFDLYLTLACNLHCFSGF